MDRSHTQIHMCQDEILKQDGTTLLLLEYDMHGSVKPLTPERIALTYAAGGPTLPFLERVYAVGADPTSALQALGQRVGWGELTNFEPQANVRSDLEQWYYRFLADGTSMKAAGRYVPGGVIVTWWK